MVKGVEQLISTVVQWLRASNNYIYRGAVVKGVEHTYIYRGAVMVKGVEQLISTVVQWLRASNILYLPWCSG